MEHAQFFMVIVKSTMLNFTIHLHDHSIRAMIECTCAPNYKLMFLSLLLLITSTKSPKVLVCTIIHEEWDDHPNAV